MLEFYALKLSAFCAKVRIVLRLKGVTFVELEPPDGYGSPAYRDIVPAGSIPAIRWDGFVLHDSDAIVEYLEDIFTSPMMRPGDVRTRAALRALARYHDTELEPAVRLLFPLVSQRDDDAADTAINIIDQRLTRLAGMCNPDPYLWGSRISLSDVCFPATVHMAEDIAGALDRAVSVPPAIQQWMGELKKHPIINESVIEFRTALGDWIDTRLRG